MREFEMREFESGATRDDDTNKLDYARGLSPIVLKRYMEYLRKHRKQADGKLRDYDNWKKCIPVPVYQASLLRHVMDLWLNLDGYTSEQAAQDSLCAILFNATGLLHEMLKADGTSECVSSWTDEQN